MEISAIKGNFDKDTVEFIREQERKSLIFKGSREHGNPTLPNSHGWFSLLLNNALLSLFFKDELNATRYCGPREFVSCAEDIESKKGVTPENKLFKTVFILLVKV